MGGKAIPVDVLKSWRRVRNLISAWSSLGPKKCQGVLGIKNPQTLSHSTKWKRGNLVERFHIPQQYFLDTTMIHICLNQSTTRRVPVHNFGRVGSVLPYLGGIKTWNENIGTTPDSTTVECSVEYPEAAAALIDLAVGLDEPTSMMLNKQKQATVKKLTAHGKYHELSITCSKIDGKWVLAQPLDRDGGSYPLNEQECPVIPRKVMAVFAKKDGTELYKRDGSADSFDVQRFESENHSQDKGKIHYFAHDRYGETDYESVDDEEDKKYDGDGESPTKKPRMQMKTTDDFPWTRWTICHGPLVVIYRHPVAVATFNLNRIVENRRRVCKCFMCEFWSRADANEVWKTVEEKLNEDSEYNFGDDDNSIPVRDPCRDECDYRCCECYYICRTACADWVDRKEYGREYFDNYSVSDYKKWHRSQYAIRRGLRWIDSSDISTSELDEQDDFSDFMDYFAEDRAEEADDIPHHLISDLCRLSAKRMFAAVEVSLNDDEYKCRLPTGRLPRELYKLCQMIRVAEVWSAISVQEELLKELANRVSESNTIHLGKALTTVYTSIYADGFADGLMEMERHGAIVLNRATTEAMHRYARAAGADHLVDDLHGIVAHEADAQTVNAMT